LIGIYPPVKVLSSTKKVSYGVTLAREVNKFKIVIFEEFLPSGLSRGDLLWRFEIGKVLMIRSNDELLLCAQKKVPECFYGIDDG
jgi:hypothetical protein